MAKIESHPFTPIALAIVRKRLQEGTDEWATLTTDVLGWLTGNTNQRISQQTINHWVPKSARGESARVPANRDQAWAFALAAGYFLNRKLERPADEERRELVADVQRLVTVLDYRPLPTRLVDAALTNLGELKRVLTEDEFRPDLNAVRSTLNWLLSDSANTHSIMCVAALSPPKMDRHPEALEVFGEFLNNGGVYTLCVPFNSALTRDAGLRGTYGMLLYHYNTILEESMRTITLLRKALKAKWPLRNIEARTALFGLREKDKVKTALMMSPPLAGVEARPVFRRSISSNIDVPDDRLACLVTEDGEDRFFPRSRTGDPDDRDGTRRDRLRSEREAVAEYFHDLLQTWQEKKTLQKDMGKWVRLM